MSSSASRGSERMVQQDFIARIRFQNTLPPPPIPPKLLDVPNTGLASGQYTNPAFASRLAREQPLNIEADAELGMPLDLVGMPGIFDGDESSIQAPAQPGPIHPNDRALLKPLSTLGKPKVGDNSVSFLRRTEYIASSKKRSDADARRKVPKISNKRKSPEPEANTPAYIKRKIEKSFEAAAMAITPATRAKATHPSKKDVTMVEVLPMLPDLNAFPDSGTYVTIKFLHGPLPSSTDSTSANSKYDTRLLSSVFRPVERTASEEAAYVAALEAHQADPDRNPLPPNGTNYDLFLADTIQTSDNFRTKFDLENPNRDDEDLYTATLSQGRDGRCFRFNRVRGYETAEEKELTHETKYSEEILISCGEGDGGAGTRTTAAWFYPVMQRSVVRSQRTKNMARMYSQVPDGDDQQVDALDMVVSDPSKETAQQMAKFRNDPLQVVQDHEEAPTQQLQEEAGAAVVVRDGSRSPAPNGDAHSDDADGDAEGETVQDMEEDAEGDEED